MPPWQLRCGRFFRNGPSFIRFPLLPLLNNFINFKALVYANLLFYYCSSVLQSFALVLFQMVIALLRLFVVRLV